MNSRIFEGKSYRSIDLYLTGFLLGVILQSMSGIPFGSEVNRLEVI